MNLSTDPTPQPEKKPFSAPYPPIRRQIILDGIAPKDFRELNIIYCCEQCSYYDLNQKKCAMGFRVEKHQKENQLRLYNLTGKMAICRSQEID